jgi:LysR family transcriptional regulator for metE and metH
MDLEIRHLLLVEAIALEGGVTRAGERLHLTQSALSHRLRDIEARLGVPLFLRLRRKMVPTPAGERLLALARPLLAQVRRAEEEIRLMGGNGAGILRFAVECYTCYHWLPRLLDAYRRKFPRVEVRIAADETPRPIAALFEGRLDLAMVSSRVADRRIHLRPLFEDEFVVVMPPGHPLAARSFVRPQDFAAENLLMYSAPEENTAMQRVLAPAGVAPSRVTQVRLTEAILELVKAGQGLAVLAAWSVAPHVDSGALVARPLTRRGLVRRWQAARLKGDAPPAHLLAFEDLLAKGPLGVKRGFADLRRRSA